LKHRAAKPRQKKSARAEFLASLSPEDRAFVEATDTEFSRQLDDYMRDYSEALIDRLVELGEVTKERGETAKRKVARRAANRGRRTR